MAPYNNNRSNDHGGRPPQRDFKPRRRPSGDSGSERDSAPRRSDSRDGAPSRDFKPRRDFNRDHAQGEDSAPRRSFNRDGASSRDFKPRRDFNRDHAQGEDSAPRRSFNRDGGPSRDFRPRRDFDRDRLPDDEDSAPRRSFNRDGGPSRDFRPRRDSAPRRNFNRDRAPERDFAPRRAPMTPRDQERDFDRMKSQARAVNAALLEIWKAVFRDNRPADRALNLFFREHRQYGSQDRRLVSESIFAIFRWWGFLRKLIPAEQAAGLESRDVNAPLPEFKYEELAAVLLGGWLLEQKPLPDVVAVWCDTLDVEPAELEEKLADADNYLTVAIRMFPLLRRRLGGGSAKLETRDLLPDWVPAMLPEGLDAVNLSNWFQRRPPMWLRAQCHNIEALFTSLGNYDLSARRHDYMKQAIRVDGYRVNLFTIAEFRGGLFEVQDLASQSIGVVAAPQPGERWWDACAGAGGKTLQLADLMQRKGTVVASDIRGYKLDDLRLRARRAGFPNISTKEWDGKALRKKQQEKYDGVLVDAPCTCSGTWRRNPDARWTLSQPEVPEMATLQLNILTHASTGVRPGGVLVYSTCSLFAEENNGVVERFLAENPDFSLEPFPHPLAEGKICQGMVQIYPWEGDCDAMFVARLRRR